MYKVLILVCAATLDRAACTPETALDVVRAMRVDSPQQCAFMGQAQIAPTALKPEPGKHYIKILCVPDGRRPKVAGR